MYVQDISTKDVADIPADGVLVSRKCAELFDLSEGSTVEFMDAEGNPKEFHVVAVTTCKNCGEKVSPDAKYCAACGTKVEEEQ